VTLFVEIINRRRLNNLVLADRIRLPSTRKAMLRLAEISQVQYFTSQIDLLDVAEKSCETGSFSGEIELGFVIIGDSFFGETPIQLADAVLTRTSGPVHGFYLFCKIILTFEASQLEIK